jgi:hypothetical protein
VTLPHGAVTQPLRPIFQIIRYTLGEEKREGEKTCIYGGRGTSVGRRRVSWKHLTTQISLVRFDVSVSSVFIAKILPKVVTE